jgi:hypothetical protein
VSPLILIALISGLIKGGFTGIAFWSRRENKRKAQLRGGVKKRINIPVLDGITARLAKGATRKDQIVADGMDWFAKTESFRNLTVAASRHGLTVENVKRRLRAGRA